MPTHNELRELVERLEQHASLHDSLGDASEEQSQWASDLRHAISLLNRAPVCGVQLSEVERKCLESVRSNSEHDAGDVYDTAPAMKDDEDAHWAYHTYWAIDKLLAAAPAAPVAEGEMIHVNVIGGEVFEAPLDATGFADGIPRFVVTIPAQISSDEDRAIASAYRRWVGMTKPEDLNEPFAEFVRATVDFIAEHSRSSMAAAPAVEVDEAKALATFTEYFVKNYPGPDTIICDPNWHAPKIFRAAKYALTAALGREGGGNG